MTIIAFLTPNLNFRGSCVALRDYALYNELLLHNKSIIITYQNQPHDDIAFKWIATRFPLFIANHANLPTILVQNKVETLYIIKYGLDDGIGRHSLNIKTIVHCVFDMSQPHGDVYAGVSKTLASKFGSNVFVPHMISLIPTPGGDSLREEFNIPKNARVFGRMGGYDTFNLPFAKEVLSAVVRDVPDIYFVCMVAEKWDDHPRLIFLQPTTDLERKHAFLRTLDAVIIAETLGHTFHQSLGESCAYGIPAIVYNGEVWNRAHLDILGDCGIYFDDAETLNTLVRTFTPHRMASNPYASFTPENVMDTFQKVFLN